MYKEDVSFYTVPRFCHYVQGGGGGGGGKMAAYTCKNILS